MWFEKLCDKVAFFFGYDSFKVADDLSDQIAVLQQDLNACELLLDKLGVTEVKIVETDGGVPDGYVRDELHAELGPNPDHRMVELLYEHCDQLTIDAPPESEPLPPTYHFGQRDRIPVTLIKADDMAPDPLTVATDPEQAPTAEIAEAMQGYGEPTDFSYLSKEPKGFA